MLISDNLSHSRNWLILRFSGLIMVVATVLWLYVPTVDNGFVNYDDYDYIVNNTPIHSLDMNLLRWSFGGIQQQFYIPFTWLSLALDYFFWGLDPKGYHLTNNILHALNSGWVTLLSIELVRLGQRRQQANYSEVSLHFRMIAVGLAAGLIFGLHPLRVESVAWATERKDVLSAFFALPTLIAYLRYVSLQSEAAKSSALKWYFTALALFICSLLSKPMMVTMPAVLLLLDWFPLNRLTCRREVLQALKEKIPFALLSAGFLVVLLSAQLTEGVSLERVPLVSRLLLAFSSVFKYFWMHVWPAGLVPLYPHPGNEVYFDDLRYLAPVLFFAAVSMLAVRQACHDDRKWLWAWGYFLITLLPVLGFTQVGAQAMADRYTYLPCVLPTILVAMLLYDAVHSSRLSRVSLVVVRIGIAAVLAGLLVGYGAVSRNLIAVWRDSESLWSRVIEIRPMESADAYHHRGYFYADRGDYDRALEDLGKSIVVAELKQPHNLSYAYLGRGHVFMKLGRYQEAYEDFTRGIAVSAKPSEELHAAQLIARRLLETGKK